MDNYLDWKFKSSKLALYISLIVFFTVHLAISLHFCLNSNIKLIKLFILFFSYLTTFCFLFSKTTNYKLVWSITSLNFFATNFFSLLNDQYSSDFFVITGVSLSTIITGVSLLIWFLPLFAYIIQIFCTFAAYIIMGIINKNNPPIFVYTMVFPVGLGTIIFSFIIDRFSKKLFEYQKINKKLTYTDSLTSVFNRQYINKHITIDERMKFNGYVLMLDIDHFKKINDSFGHYIGDLALCNFVKIINDNIRKEDILIRFGGEEFLIFIIESDLKTAKTIADRIRVNTKENSFEPNFTCSIGISYFDKNERFENVIKKVDDKLYEAKNSGRNKICY